MTTMSVEELQTAISADDMKPLKPNDPSSGANVSKKKDTGKEAKKKGKNK